MQNDSSFFKKRAQVLSLPDGFGTIDTRDATARQNPIISACSTPAVANPHQRDSCCPRDLPSRCIDQTPPRQLRDPSAPYFHPLGSPSLLPHHALVFRSNQRSATSSPRGRHCFLWSILVVGSGPMATAHSVDTYS